MISKRLPIISTGLIDIEPGGTNVGDVQQFARGYRILAELNYRPAARGDGHGNLDALPKAKDLEAEALKYARDFERMDASMKWEAGCTDSRLAHCAVLALEAFRLMNAGAIWHRGETAETLVPRLLRRAAEEYERAVEEDLIDD
jgi:hypothetical protein